MNRVPSVPSWGREAIVAKVWFQSNSPPRTAEGHLRRRRPAPVAGACVPLRDATMGQEGGPAGGPGEILRSGLGAGVVFDFVRGDRPGVMTAHLASYAVRIVWKRQEISGLGGPSLPEHRQAQQIVSVDAMVNRGRAVGARTTYDELVRLNLGRSPVLVDTGSFQQLSRGEVQDLCLESTRELADLVLQMLSGGGSLKVPDTDGQIQQPNLPRFWRKIFDQPRRDRRRRIHNRM